MIEICEFHPEEIDETIEALDVFQQIIAPLLRSINYEEMGEEDVQDFTRHITLAKHAMILVGDFLEAQMGGQPGRLAVFPCKVGDLLYEVDMPEYGVITCKVLHMSYFTGPFAHCPGNPIILTAAVAVEVIEGHGIGSSHTFETEDFGKSVFLNRQDAEASLAKALEHLPRPVEEEQPLIHDDELRYRLLEFCDG